LRWLMIVVLIIMLMCFGQTATACSDHSGGSQSGGQSSDTGDSSGSADSGTSGGSADTGTSSSSAGGSSGDGNGHTENPCQYYWNWGSAKLKCKPPFGE